jgi:hypothetical protein
VKTISGTALYAAGDAVNVPLGRPSTINGGKKDGVPAGPFALPATTTVKQTKYKVKKFVEYHSDPLVLTMSNNISSIEDFLVNIVQEVYQGLDDKDSLIKATPSLRSLAKDIAKANELSRGGNIVIIPKAIASKKSIADLIIDDVAEV